jgi:hypothetical protein
MNAKALVTKQMTAFTYRFSRFLEVSLELQEITEDAVRKCHAIITELINFFLPSKINAAYYPQINPTTKLRHLSPVYDVQVVGHWLPGPRNRPFEWVHLGDVHDGANV